MVSQSNRSSDDTPYWLALNLVQRIGNMRLQQLLSHFGTAERAWKASEYDLRQAGLSSTALTSLLKAQRSLNIDAEMKRVERANAHLITFLDERYPPNLRDIPDPPMLLYVRGTVLPTDTQALAIVGTRSATRYGRDVADRMAYWLAQQNVTIVSGMAHGIDAAAHHGALNAQGRTIAVMGCGIDTIYPSDHEQLAQQIVDNGALISELPLGVPPSGSNFPRRNRLISGLALGVLIAEAPLRSGALITAEAALEQGREVFATPANIFNQQGTGGNRLIQEGAKLVMRAQDVLDELSMSYTERQTRTRATEIAPDSDIESQVLSYLESDPIHVDDIIRESSLSPQDVVATLTLLELKGLAQQVGPMQYCRAR